MRHTLLKLGAVAMIALGVVACGGDDGAAGPAGPAGSVGATGPTGPTGPAAGSSVNLSGSNAITPEQFAALQINATIDSVTIASPPVVKFTLTTADGKPILGFGSKSQSSTATVAQYPNFAFSIAKLVPGVDGSPSKWINYIVTRVPTTTASGSCAANAVCLQAPGTDNTGTLTEDGNGKYTYTFYRDITTIKDVVTGITPPSGSDKADLGDLTYDPSLQHRLVMQISGAAPGTGTNTTDGVQVTAAVNLETTVNASYDFVPASGPIAKSARLKDNVNIESCNTCHDRLAFHGGGARVDTDYCTICHTQQRAFGRVKVVSTNNAFPALTETKTVNSVTGITSYTYSPSTYVGDGEVMGHFTTLIHKIHQGGSLVKQNYNYANVAFNLKNFSMLDDGQRMCSVCHDGTKIASTAQNWINRPSREACGACHDGVNFATGVGHGDNNEGRARQDDKECVLCHGAAQTKVDHQTLNLTKNNPTITAGLVSFRYDIKSVTVNSTSNDVTIEFAIFQSVAPSTAETPVTFVTPAASVTNPLAGFTGGPSFLIAFAQSQDGVTTPADYNNLKNNLGANLKQGQPVSVSIAALLSTSNSARGSMVASTANPGYYTVTLKGDTTNGAWAFPVGAKMRSVSLQGYFTQVTAPASATVPIARHAISVVKPVTGDAVRRVVADSAKCANCHEWFEGHGGNRVYEVQVCVTCHNPALATSGRGISDTSMQNYAFSASDLKKLAEWGVDRNATNAALKLPVTSNNMKDMIHGIHAGRDRVTPFMDARDRTPSAINLLDFRRMDFPGILNNCETCHVTATNTTTTYNSIPTTNSLVSTYESRDSTYDAAITAGNATPAMAKSSLNQANATDVVVMPFSAACVTCHDGAAAKSHIDIQGGTPTPVRRDSARAQNIESCSVCHGPGASVDAAVVHK